MLAPIIVSVNSFFTIQNLVFLRRLVKPPEQKFINRTEIPVDMCPDHQNVHQHVEPEHQNDHCGQTPVSAEIIVVIHIDGKGKGRDTPQHCRKRCPRDLCLKPQLAARHKGIDHGKNKCQNHP